MVKILPGNKPQIIDKAPSGKVYLDGNINVETDSQSIKDRKNLSANGYLEITLIVSNNGSIKKPVISYKGIPEKNEDDTFIFDIEDEIMNICRTFSMDNKKQQQNLIETLKQNCRRIVREKNWKKTFYKYQYCKDLMGITGSIIVYVMIWWIIFFSVLPIGIQSNKEVFKEKIGGMDPGAPKNPKIAKKFLITTLITSIIFIVIYYLVENDFLNLREFLQ